MLNWKLALVAVAVLAFANAMAAQEPESPEKPKPAGRGIPPLGEPTVQDENAVQEPLTPWKSDTMPLTGLQSPTVGNPEFRHSYLVPGLQYASTIQNQPSSVGKSGSWYSNNYLGGNLSLLQEWPHSQLAVNYSGGGVVTTQSGQNNGWYQQLGFGQTFSGRRWQMQILDQFGYLPQSQFGFGGGTGLSLPGIAGSLGPSVPGIDGSVVPNQSIYAAVGPRYSNAVVTQITYQASSRGSFTMAGSYGLLHFTQAGNVDTDTYIGNVGYNYLLTKVDSIGLFYRVTEYHYPGEPQAIGDQVINVAYGRKVTRRLALQLNAGLEIIDYRVPAGRQTLTGNGGESLTYTFQNGDFSVNYLHGLVGGSGVLVGSNTDQISLGAGRRLTRLWHIHGNFGYALNRPLGNQAGTQGNDYTSMFAGGGVDRPIGRDVNISLAYTAQIQHVNPTVCTGPSCNTSYTQNFVTISLQWHTRPFVIQ